MGIPIVVIIIFFFPFLLFIAYLALSSCLGNEFRASLSGDLANRPRMSFGRNYGQTLGSGAGQAGWEQIEMEDLISADNEMSD
jgi:hypothetical protein